MITHLGIFNTYTASGTAFTPPRQRQLGEAATKELKTHALLSEINSGFPGVDHSHLVPSSVSL